jgi:hypothetical protein
VSPKDFLDEIKEVMSMQLEVLQLGIMNLSVPELKRIFKEIFNAFPKLEKFNMKVQYMSDKGVQLKD